MSIRRLAPSHWIIVLALAFAASPAAAANAAWLSAGGWWLELMRYQGQLHHQLADAMRGLREGDPVHAALILGALSLFYGVVHAAGPGHGKAVISSYLLADGATIGSGVALAFASALAQAATAVVIVLVGWFILGLAGFQLTQVASYAEVASFALVAALGCGMMVVGAARLWDWFRRGRQPALHQEASHHEHSAGCGHIHAPLPVAEGPNRRWRTAGVVLAVGIRPCTGALIVLLFALVNGLLMAGIASTLAMALGTAVTVSALAALSVQAKLLALRLFSASQERLRLINGCLCLGGGLVVTTLGVAMLLTPGTSAPF